MKNSLKIVVYLYENEFSEKPYKIVNIAIENKFKNLSEIENYLQEYVKNYYCSNYFDYNILKD